MNLKKKTFSSARWNILRMAVVYFLQLVQLAILARLLDPAHFGEIAIVLITLMFAELLSQTGIELHMVRSRECVKPLLNAAWSVQLLRGAALAVLLFILAAPIGDYQESSRLVGLMMVAALVPLIDGCRNIGPVLLARELEQARIVIAEIIVTALSVVIALVLAFILRSPWALAFHVVIFTAFKTIASYLIHPHRPRLTFAWSPLRPLIRFGVYLNLAMTTGYVILSLDKFVLGKVFGHEQLGLYERAFLLSNVAVLYLPRFLSATVIPSFAKLAETPDRFRYHTRRYLILLVTLFVAVPAGLALFSRPIFWLVYGDKLQAALPLFQIFLLHTCFCGIATGITTLFVLLGRAHLFFRCQLAQLVVLSVALPVALRYGTLEAVCLSVSLCALVGLAAAVWFAGRGGLAPESTESPTEPNGATPPAPAPPRSVLAPLLRLRFPFWARTAR